MQASRSITFGLLCKLGAMGAGFNPVALPQAQYTPGVTVCNQDFSPAGFAPFEATALFALFHRLISKYGRKRYAEGRKNRWKMGVCVWGGESISSQESKGSFLSQGEGEGSESVPHERSNF